MTTDIFHCSTEGCPWPDGDEGREWHIPWCKGIHKCFGTPEHQHWPKKQMGGKNLASRIVAILCSGMHDAVDNSPKFGNAVVTNPVDGSEDYLLWRTKDGKDAPPLIRRQITPPKSNPTRTDATTTMPIIEGVESIEVSSDRLRRAIALSEDVREVKDIRDKAEALREYAKAAHLGLEAQNEVADLKIRAERKAGQLIAGMEKHPPGPDRSHDVTDLPPKLAELGIGKGQSSRWQREAEVPDSEYDAYAQTCMETETELTTAGVLRLHAALFKEPKEEGGCDHEWVCTKCGEKR